MIKKLRPIMGTIFVLTFLLSACASLSMAQQNSVKSSSRLERERLSKIMDSQANVEEFRQEYLNYLTEIQDNMRLLTSVPAVQRQLSRAGLRVSPMLTSAKNSVTQMSQQDLIKIRAAYAKFPGWREMPSSLIRADIRQELEEKYAAKKAGVIVNNAGTTDNCADGINAGITNTDISIAKAAQLVAEGIMEALPTDAITILAREASVIAYIATEGVTLSLETLKGIKDDCRDDSFQDSITTKVDAVPGLISTSTSTTATNITNAKTAIINNDNANTTTIVNNDNANLVTVLAKIEAAKTYIVTDAHANKDEMKNLLLRTQIEADLSSTDGSTFVALYETPSNVCLTSLTDKGLPQTITLPGMPTETIPQCGLLDLVRSIVRDTIANVGAGTNAQSFFATAEAQRAAGKYKQAYTYYRMAYKAASK
jgi:hypothetical protein